MPKPLSDLCADLQSLQRQRRSAQKLRIMLSNALTSTVATSQFGYYGGLQETERRKLWSEAERLIKVVDSGSSVDTDLTDVIGLIHVSRPSRQGFADFEANLLDAMVDLAKELPVADWIDSPPCRGISHQIVATIIGESGDLWNYANPAKLWRRIVGCPYTKHGKTQMPSTWRRETNGKGLSAQDWTELGYNPRRHAAIYSLKENIVKQNQGGPYRARYDEAKRRAFETHPEWNWKPCKACKGGGCEKCLGIGQISGHAHSHAQLLAAKRFLRDLWNRWRSFDG